MNFDTLDQLWLVGPIWIGMATILAAILAVVVVRRLLPAREQHRGRGTLWFLLTALLLRVSGAAALQAGFYTAWVLLGFLDLLFLVLGGTGLARLLIFDCVLARSRFRVSAILRDLAQAAVVAVCVAVLLYRRGFDPLSLLTTSAVLTAVIGLALQNAIANLFAGLGLQLDRTFRIGDWIQVSGTIGRIAEIRLRSTTLRTDDGDALIVPNRQLVDAEVLNFARPEERQRMSIRVGFHYRHPPNEVKRTLLDAVCGTHGVLSAPVPDCVLVDFADSAVTYALRYWIVDFANRVPIESEVRTRIWYAAQQAGLEIPYPIRTIIIPPSAPAEVLSGQGDQQTNHALVPA